MSSEDKNTRKSDHTSQTDQPSRPDQPEPSDHADHTEPANQGKKANRLIYETSPYLQQHARNPVDWYPWGKEALERARTKSRMIFLSIGYSSCHWCHVMERESFEDPYIARLLNKHFVNIKVDREERPDIDAVYMEALQMMTGQGGWPLNIWLTPDQIPVFAGTYFPPQDAHGRPGFASVITRLAEIYRSHPDKIEQQTKEMRKALSNDIYDHLDSGSVTPELLDRAFKGYADIFDEKDGGFSAAPKFPTAMSIGFLLRYSHRPGSDQARHMVLFSLEKMISGGIYDQVGGGFHRYSTDEKWLVPHFEKMLYDNALLLPVLAEAAQITGRDLFARTVDETITFLNREMRHPGGAYYSALDADTEGVEGKFYTFTRDEVADILEKDDFDLLTAHYGIESGGNWEGVTVLHRAVPLKKLAKRYGSDEQQLQTRLDAARHKLLIHRDHRVRPGLDDKVITSWNALMLIALCRCSRLLDRDAGDAVSLGRFLSEHAVQGDALFRIIDRDGNAKEHGFLDDYALLSDGFSRLFELTGDMHWLKISVKLVQLMIDRFYDDTKSAFRYTSKQDEQLVAQTRDIFDNAQPGGSTAAIAALQRVGHLAGIPEWTRLAASSMEPLTELASTHPAAFGYLLQDMHQQLYPGKEIVIASGQVGAGMGAGLDAVADKMTRRMLDVWKKRYDPSSFVITLNAENRKEIDDSSLYGSKNASDIPKSYIGQIAQLYGSKTAIDGMTTAYICQNFQCSNPVQSIGDFKREIHMEE